MRKLIVHEFVTMDGVMQAPGGRDEYRDGGFEHGGWTLPYWHDDIGMAFGSHAREARRRQQMNRTQLRAQSIVSRGKA